MRLADYFDIVIIHYLASWQGNLFVTFWNIWKWKFNT